jgi:hypothetical protein
MWGAKSPDKDKIGVMQAELTTLKGQFQLALNLKKGTRVKDDQGGGNSKKRRTRRTMLTRESRKRMRIGRIPLQRMEKLMRRK